MNWLKEAQRRLKSGYDGTAELTVVAILAVAQAIEHLALAQAGWEPNENGDGSLVDDPWDDEGDDDGP